MPYPQELRWTGKVHNAGFEVANCGQNGLDIATCVESPEAVSGLISSLQPIDKMIVMLGTNDILGGVSAERTAQRMGKLLTLVLQDIEAKKLLLIAPVALLTTSWVPDKQLAEETKKLGALYCALAERMGISFADAEKWQLPLAFDGVHLSINGHARFAEKLLPLLTEE